MCMLPILTSSSGLAEKDGNKLKLAFLDVIHSGDNTRDSKEAVGKGYPFTK